MTVKKRLFLSNILMIVVPAAATLLIGVLCVGFIWLALINGVGLGIHDEDEFDLACAAITEGIEKDLKTGGDMSSIEDLLSVNDMSVAIYTDGKNVYSYGNAAIDDADLIRAAQIVGDDALIAQSGRIVCTAREHIDGTDYDVYIAGNYDNPRSYSDLKTAMVFAEILIAFTIVISILMTNRFLTRFVLKRVEEPLDILAEGAREIGHENLEYRIEYNGKDEFAPVCEAFNNMAERLQTSIERIQKDEESRKELLAGISHDIRSPLTSIQAYVEGLLDGVASTPEIQRRYLDTVRKKVTDIDRLVSQLFLFSKLDLDEYPMDIRTLRLDEMAVMLVQENRNDYLERGLDIELTGQSASPVSVKADPAQLHRMLVNIMDNSAKYKVNEVGHLDITVDTVSGYGRIVLSDDGPGVSDEALPKLFDVFYRSDPARKNPAGGSGLGLAIAAKTVDKMGGNITAENRPQGGLSVIITLPLESLENTEGKNDAEDTDNRR